MHLVVLGELQHDALEREAGQQLAALRRQQGLRGDVERHVAVDVVEQCRAAGQGEQLQAVPLADAVGLVEDDVGRALPLRGEAAERLGADPGAGAEADDGLQDDVRPAGGHDRCEAVADLGVALLQPHLRLDDQGRGVGEHIHQRQVAR